MSARSLPDCPVCRPLAEQAIAEGRLGWMMCSSCLEKRHEDGAEDFTDILIAAMLDAAVEGRCSQLQTTITPPGHGPKLVRLIVIPEELGWTRPDSVGKFTRPA